jgi:TatD DNase family protein
MSSQRTENGHNRFVDTHCHLDDEGFANDLDEILDRARADGVTRWINVGFNPDRWEAAVALGKDHPGMSYMLGVHPGDAPIWDEDVHKALQNAVALYQPVAIGEIGLDFFRGETNGDEQVAAFNAQLDLALDHGIPAAIHMRDAEEIILSVLNSRDALPTLLFHSFDGSEAMTNWVLDSGSYIGVGGLATRTKSTRLQDQISRIPLERIVLETDSPYLVPNGFKHRRNTPESIPRIAAFLGQLLGHAIDDIAMQTTANAERLFERLSPE